MRVAGLFLTGFLLFIAAGCRYTSDNKKPDLRSDSLSIIAERIALDFPFTESDIDKQLKERIGDFTPEEKAEWENKNWLEWRIIDGEKKYFSRAASNLALLRSFHLDRPGRDSLEAADSEMVYRRKHTRSIIMASENRPDPVLPADMTISIQPIFDLY